jgi:hypothetical protein
LAPLVTVRFSQTAYHDGAPVKGGAAVAKRPKALEGKKKTQSSLCCLSTEAKAH